MTERIMYCCTGCIDHAPEGCGYFDRTMLRLMPDDRWLCDACFDDDPLEDRDGDKCWSDYPPPPEYGPLSATDRGGK